jgi:hypothetical protein
MRFALSIPVLALSFCLSGQAVENAPKAPAGTAEPWPAIFAPKAALKQPSAVQSATPRRPSRRAISAAMAEKLVSVVAQAATADPGSLPTDAPTASSTSAATIVRLAPYIVRERKQRELKDRDLLTLEALRNLEHQRSPGMTMEDVRRKEIGDLEGLLIIGGEKPSREVLRMVKQSQMRSSEWIDQDPGTPFREPR